MIRMIAIVLLIGVVGMVSGESQASLITNGSFENGISPGNFTTIYAPDSISIDAWQVISGNVDYIGTYWQASDGSRSVDMSGFLAGTIRQSFTTTPGEQYFVSFDLAGNPDAPGIKTLNVSVGNFDQDYTFDTTYASKDAMSWQTYSFTFTASGSLADLSFISKNNNGYGPALDNVIVSPLNNPVPEPASILLISLGVAGIGFLRRRLRN